MSQNVVSAVFDSRSEAERAVSEMRNFGIPDTAISIVSRHDDQSAPADGESDGHGKGGIAAAVAGGGIAGAALGVAILAIPGVGPLAAAGAIAASAVPTMAGIGAGLGATGGAIAKMLTDHDVDGRDAEYYEKSISEGGVFVSVDTRQAQGEGERAREILMRSGGHSASQPRASTTDPI